MPGSPEAFACVTCTVSMRKWEFVLFSSGIERGGVYGIWIESEDVDIRAYCETRELEDGGMMS